VVVDLSRVVVVGTSCSGKTTLARRLATILNAPYSELDALYWGPEWTPRADFRETVLAVARQPRWVIDGNYSAVRDLVWRRCTATVWLDYSFARVFARALRRTARRVVGREPLYSGNRETVTSALFDREAPLWLVVRTHRKRRRDFPALLAQPEYGHAGLIRLRTPRMCERFLTEARTQSEHAARGWAP
jgi:adenylate kinase family enzyme